LKKIGERHLLKIAMGCLLQGLLTAFLHANVVGISVRGHSLVLLNFTDKSRGGKRRNLRNRLFIRLVRLEILRQPDRASLRND